MRHKYAPKRNRDIFAKELEKRFAKPIKDILYDFHWKEELPALTIAKLFEISRQTVIRLMDDYKIPRRSIREDNHRRFKNMPLEKRKKYTENANKAMRGRLTPVIERNRRAKTLQAICKLSKHEQPFFEFLKHNGFNPVPLYAIAIFNIDFAFPEEKIAIELDGGNFHNSKPHSIGDKRKETYLINKGWIVLRIRFSKGKWSPSKESFATNLSELLKERASTQPR